VYDRILVPLDGASVSEPVLTHVAALAGRFNALVTLVQVVAPPVYPPVPVLPGSYTDPERTVERERQEGQRELDRLAEVLRAQGLSVVTAQLEGTPANELAGYARRHDDDLVVMADPARSGLGRLFSDRVAETLLQGASCPVLLVPLPAR